MKSNTMLFEPWKLPGKTLVEKIVAALNHYQDKTGVAPTHVFMRTPVKGMKLPGWAEITVSQERHLRSNDIAISCESEVDRAKNRLTQMSMTI